MLVLEIHPAAVWEMIFCAMTPGRSWLPQQSNLAAINPSEPTQRLKCLNNPMRPGIGLKNGQSCAIQEKHIHLKLTSSSTPPEQPSISNRYHKFFREVK